MMRLLVRTSAVPATLVALAFLALSNAPRVLAQSTTATTAAPAIAPSTYIAIDPLAKVRYDNRFDLSLSMAYGHIHAGPDALQGANLGGLDLSASYWFKKHWAAEGSGRSYLGTSGVASVGGTNVGLNNVRGPFVSQYMIVAGPEWLGPHNKHGDIMLHVLGGGAYFLSHDWPQTPAGVGFYDNQFAPAAVFGGHIDLNRSEHWVFRMTPDALYTHYGYSFNAVPAATNPHNNWNAAFSVGVEYKFSKKR